MRLVEGAFWIVLLIGLVAWGWLFTEGPLGPGKIIPGVLW